MIEEEQRKKITAAQSTIFMGVDALFEEVERLTLELEAANKPTDNLLPKEFNTKTNINMFTDTWDRLLDDVRHGNKDDGEVVRAFDQFIKESRRKWYANAVKPVSDDK